MFAKYKEKFLQGLREFAERLIFFGKWLLLATGMGILAGMLGAGFYHCLMGATEFRQGHPFLILGCTRGALSSKREFPLRISAVGQRRLRFRREL